MWFWWFVFASDLLIPILMLVFGRMMWKHPPKDINGIIGYRTARSMKNLDTWKFAHDYCGRLWWKIGCIMFPFSFLAHIPFYHSSETKIGILSGILCTIECVVLIGSIFPVQQALKKTFTKEGIRR